MLDDFKKANTFFLQKSEFEKRIKEYLTIEEYKTYKNALVTKTEFEQGMFIGFTGVIAEMKAMINDLRTEFLTSIATVMEELKSMLEEMAAVTFHSQEISDTIENHEERISSIENKFQ